MCRVICSCGEMRSDGNVSKCQDKAVFFGVVNLMCVLHEDGCAEMKTLLDALSKHYIWENAPDHLRGFALKLSVRNTVTRVPPLDVANSLTLKESYLWAGRTTECVCTVIHKWLNLRGSYRHRLRVYIWIGPVPGRRVVCQLWANSSQLSGLTALTQSPLSAPFHSDTLIQFHTIWLLLYLVLIKRTGVYLSGACHPWGGIN